ncbi:MAG: hypothetical protein ACR2NN_06790 [Bryobacteraceae bacterium]
MLNGRFADYQLPVTNSSEAKGAVRALQRAGVDCIKVHRMTPRDAYFGVAEHVETLFEGTFSGARDDIPLADSIRRFKGAGAQRLFERFA